jgi:hypothetical protein
MHEREAFLAILRPAIEHMATYEANGKVGPPVEVSVPDGIGFEWTTPWGFRVAVRAVGPLSNRAPDGRIVDDHAVIEVGRHEPGKEIEWLTLPAWTIGDKPSNSECRYSAPAPNESQAATFERYERIYWQIDKLLSQST